MDEINIRILTDQKDPVMSVETSPVKQKLQLMLFVPDLEKKPICLVLLTANIQFNAPWNIKIKYNFKMYLRENHLDVAVAFYATEQLT